ncbi:MAG: 50S ribosomal protein L9 [Mariprofundaceae bacterium]
MELILLERVQGLGNVGDEVTVRAGFGRNFLLPQGKAIASDESNRKLFERRRKVLEAQQDTVLAEAKVEAEKLADLNVSVIRSTSDGEHLYGSVGTTDLAELLTDAGHKIARRNIILNEQIKVVGDHDFRVRLHPDVTADMSVQVIAETA